MSEKIRFGIIGAGRGCSLIPNIYASGGEVTAICDKRFWELKKVKEKFPQVKDAEEFADYDEFLKADFDVVLLANYFNEHAKFAIKAMKAGKHVLSETISNVTLSEGVALCRAKEETGMIYALLENYPFFKENLEMQRVYKEGTLGNLVYAEGEYSHPMSRDEQNDLARGERHWRNWTPRTYYTTHALAPLMQMTDALPTKVTAMASFQPEGAEGTALRTGDAAGIILCQTDTNAVFRVIGWSNYAPHGNFYRLCCTKGGMETNHESGKMRLIYNKWSQPEGALEKCEYDIKWPDEELGKLAEGAGHGGGDFFVIYNFIKDLENGREPYWDVYRSTRAASVAILAWRSVLNGNIAYDIPDFRLEEDRKKYEFDNISPYPNEFYEVDIPCSSKPYQPSEDDLKSANKSWEGVDYVYK